MIQLSLQTAVLLYAGILGAIVFVIWAYTEFTVRRPQRHLGRQFLWRCVFCSYLYLDESSEFYTECPRCGSINAAKDKGARAVPLRKSRLQEDLHEPEPAEQHRRNPARRKRPNQRRRGPRRRK